MLPTGDQTEEQFIRRAIRLAMNGRGRVEPNPMVGCVIVKDGRVIGEGHHAQYGGPHAEPTALANCTESPEGATAYVTLEPCCHTNKQTPPCAPRLIQAKVARVVIGYLDPNPDVNGKGVAMLREAGVRVDGPVLEAAAKQLIAPFIARVAHQRPYVTLKWAESSNGKVAGPQGRRARISNPLSTRVVHELRSRCDAIMVGVNTVLNDDPQLTVRGVDLVKPRPLLQVVLDTRLRIPHNSRLVEDAGQLIVVCSRHAYDRIIVDDVKALRDRGVEVIPCPTDESGRLNLVCALEELEEWQFTHLLVEAGPTLAASFMQSNLADRVWVIGSPEAIDGTDAPSATAVPRAFAITGETLLAGDTLTEYLNPASPVFFAPEPSADFVFTAELSDST